MYCIPQKHDLCLPASSGRGQTLTIQMRQVASDIYCTHTFLDVALHHEVLYHSPFYALILLSLYRFTLNDVLTKMLDEIND